MRTLLLVPGLGAWLGSGRSTIRRRRSAAAGFPVRRRVGGVPPRRSSRRSGRRPWPGTPAGSGVGRMVADGHGRGRLLYFAYFSKCFVFLQKPGFSAAVGGVRRRSPKAAAQAGDVQVLPEGVLVEGLEAGLESVGVGGVEACEDCVAEAVGAVVPGVAGAQAALVQVIGPRVGGAGRVVGR